METPIINSELAVLSLEDSVLDFEIIVEHLKRAGYQLNVLRVETEADYVSALRTHQYNVILSDFNLPNFDAFAALNLSNEMCPEVPFICVSGMIGEEKAIELIKQGAVDYILKDRLARLPSAVQRALGEAKEKLERRKAEEDLKKSEERLRLVIKGSNDAPWDWDILSNTYYYSTQWWRQLGYLPGELPVDDTLMPKLIHLEDSEIVNKALLDAFDNNMDSYEIEFRMLHKEGCFVPILSRAFITRDSEGHAIRVTGTNMDLTERKRFEQALRASEEKFRTVANYTTDWEFWIDEKDNYVYCSPSCEGITGYNAQDFLDNSALEYQIVHPDDLEMFQFHKINETTSLKACDEFEYRIVRADGEIRWIGHVCQPIINQVGEFIGTRGGNRDITERKITEQLLKYSERKYKLVSENITDGVFICKNSVFEFVNPAMSSIFGYEKDDLRLMNPSELFGASNILDLETFLTENHSEDDVKNFEIECLTKNSSKRFVEILLHYVLNEKAIYGVVHDITEKKRIQKKNMVKAIIQTEEKERAYFAKELHDGIGPLLSTIKLYLQWTQKIKNIEQRDEIILKAEEILEDTLTSVKEISYKLSPHILEYHGLTSAIKNFSTKVEAANPIRITIQSNVHRRLEMEIEVALYRAAIECVNNSIKYSKAKNIYIQINDTGHELLLQYRDDGQGFDLEKMIAEQKGLGLFNLQNRLTSIGGKITMFSKPGLGVDYRFVVML